MNLLQSGRYTITNVRFRNMAVLPDSNNYTNIVAQCNVNDSGETWNVILLETGNYTIQSYDYSKFASSSDLPKNGDIVFGGSPWEWTIQNTNIRDHYTISPAGANVFWGLTDVELNTPITLSTPRNNSKNQWIFIKVSELTENTVSRSGDAIDPPAQTSTRAAVVDGERTSDLDNQTAEPPGLMIEIDVLPLSDITDFDMNNHLDEPPDLTGKVVRRHEHQSAGGGFSDIWEGIWNKDSGPCNVAIKVLRAHIVNDQEKLNKRLRRELKVWKRLHHENVLPLCGVTLDFGPCPSMVCPWLENGCLGNYLERCGETLTLLDRFKILGEVQSGLAYLHSSDIIHGDLTGGNVLLDGTGKACLSDFGLSIIVAEFQNTSYFSSSIHGAVRWAAPELYSPEQEAGTFAASLQSDVYSFGSVMLQTLSGKVPYYNLGDVQVILELHQGRCPPLPRETYVADEDWQFMLRCWDKRPEKRPTMDEILDFIETARARLSI